MPVTIGMIAFSTIFILRRQISTLNYSDLYIDEFDLQIFRFDQLVSPEAM
jgi:hypothetical protein